MKVTVNGKNAAIYYMLYVPDGKGNVWEFKQLQKSSYLPLPFSNHNTVSTQTVVKKSIGPEGEPHKEHLVNTTLLLNVPQLIQPWAIQRCQP